MQGFRLAFLPILFLCTSPINAMESSADEETGASTTTLSLSAHQNISVLIDNFVHELFKTKFSECMVNGLVGCACGFMYGIYVALMPLSITCSTHACDFDTVSSLILHYTLVPTAICGTFGPLVKPLIEAAWRAYYKNDREGFENAATELREALQ